MGASHGLQRNDLDTEMHVKTCLSLAQNIYRMFVVPNAPLEVNISSRIRKGICDIFAEQLPAIAPTPGRVTVTKEQCLDLVASMESAYKVQRGRHL